MSCKNAGDCDVVFTYPMFRDLERMPRVVTGLAAHVSFGANLACHGQTQNGDLDPMAIAGAALVVAVSAGDLPAGRASTVDPMQESRYE